MGGLGGVGAWYAAHKHEQYSKLTLTIEAVFVYFNFVRDLNLWWP